MVCVRISSDCWSVAISICRSIRPRSNSIIALAYRRILARVVLANDHLCEGSLGGRLDCCDGDLDDYGRFSKNEVTQRRTREQSRRNFNGEPFFLKRPQPFAILLHLAFGQDDVGARGVLHASESENISNEDGKGLANLQ